MLFRCTVCDDRAIDHDEYMGGKQLCDDCTTIRALNPKLFDYFIRILDKKIANELDSHWNSYHNDNDY